jgi:uncharacterized protein (TIGR03437 family)
MHLFKIGAIPLVFLTAAALLAQTDRLPRVIDNARRTVLTGQRTHRAQAQFDEGPVELSRQLSGVSLHFKPAAAQQAELERLLVEQQDPGSPNYHNWLTPDEYADRFGLSLDDLDKVTFWLQSWGFRVDYTARSRNWITFSGDAGQVLDAFRTEIHRYRVNGEMHYANAADPSLPSALAAIVQTIAGLDDFRLQPRSHAIAGLPRWTASSGLHAVTPGDLAVIYDINKLYSTGINGTGQSMVVVGQTNINMSDIESFRKQFGLVPKDPKMVLVPGFPDPGISSKDDLYESLLDLEYSGGIAPNANILFVYSPNVIQSLLYAIDQNLAPVISMSYGSCEATVSSGSGTASAYRSVAQQANAEGITWIASSGDSGAADCELQGQASAGSHGPSVDMPASIPEVTGVGGSEFNEGGKSYWNSTTSSTGVSALSYIPEMAWNDTVADGTLASGGGGVSIFYSKPAWQTGPGVPNDGVRDVPDVALTASGDHDPYLITLNGNLAPIGGTSAAAPVFAGIITLLNQYLVANNLQAKPGLGNINPNLYLLASNPSTASAFHDITAGSNIVPCAPGSTGCKSGSYGYNAGPGYDQATGLGSVDAYNLATNWKGGGGGGGGAATIATSITVTANPPAITVNSSTVLTVTVKAASGSASPPGSVSFNLGNTGLGTVNLSGSGGTAIASITVYGSQLTIGNNTVSVSYSGTTTFLPSRGSVPVTVTVPTMASAVIPSIVPNPIYQQAPDNDGYAWFFTVRLAEVAGTSTTLTAFSIDGVDHTADIPAWFGSTTLAAHGTLSGAIRSRGLTVPVNRVFLFSGRDNASGQAWTQQLSIPFLPQQFSASMVLSSSPGTEVQNPSGDPNCPSDHPFYQQLNLQEKNGYEVFLNKFLAGGYDLTSSIVGWFGSLRLAPLSSLQANICWKIGSVPSTLSYEVDGVDTAGYKISTTLSVPFSGPGQNTGKSLASSPALVGFTAPAGNNTANTSVNLTLPSTEQWTVSVFPANQKTSWLVVYPQSGTGAAKVNLVASAAGVAAGVYKATLVFQSVNTIPQFVNVPVTFAVGASSSVSITGITNGASFQQAYAPGMIMSVFGSGLANSTKVASAVPLPVSIDGVSATVNGVPAALYFISPGQLNIQVPYETAVGSALLGINNNGRVASASFNVKATAPGIFTAANGSVVPISSARPGDPVFLYITGDGDTTPHLATGASPAYGTPYNQLPAPLGGISMSVANIPVTPFFVGIPSGLVGATQINFNVPSNAPLGLQSVIVTVGGVASKAAALNITNSHTNSPAVAVSEALPFAFLPEAAPPLPEAAPLAKAAPLALPGFPEDAPQRPGGLP